MERHKLTWADRHSTCTCGHELDLRGIADEEAAFRAHVLSAAVSPP